MTGFLDASPLLSVAAILSIAFLANHELSVEDMQGCVAVKSKSNRQPPLEERMHRGVQFGVGSTCAVFPVDWMVRKAPAGHVTLLRTDLLAEKKIEFAAERRTLHGGSSNPDWRIAVITRFAEMYRTAAARLRPFNHEIGVSAAWIDRKALTGRMMCSFNGLAAEKKMKVSLNHAPYMVRTVLRLKPR